MLPVLFGVLLAVAGSVTPSFAADLTEDERAYVASRGPVTVCVDPDWAPFEIINSGGQHEGIAADLLSLAATRIGLSLSLVPTASWAETLEASQQGRCTLLSFLNQTPKREQWLTFTEPLFTDVNVFITREEHPYVVDPGSLEGDSIVFPRGTAMEELIRAKYPNLQVQVVEEEKDAIAAVERRQAGMTMRSLIVAAYTIKKEGWFNLKIAGQLPDYENRLRIGVIKSEARLVPILNKGIASITPAERGQIVNRHVSIKVERPIDYMFLLKLAGGLVAIIGMTAFWAYRVKRLNTALTIMSQTDVLTRVANRAKLNCDLETEVARWTRYRRPVSVILIDIDFFKQINDVHGHLTGDRVLIQVADVLSQTVRGTDSVGRWGGEEFLVICPETTLDQAVALAERLRLAVAEAPYPTGQSQTISLGVACAQKDDTPDSLLHRADTALYASKEAGRNRTTAAGEERPRVPCPAGGRGQGSA